MAELLVCLRALYLGPSAGGLVVNVSADKKMVLIVRQPALLHFQWPVVWVKLALRLLALADLSQHHVCNRN